ncbi:PI phosphatase group protein [Sporothrix schenckii 1099-18]|uniref:PI phosphatase group protein n=1 Tax=Sporothrix schenckii 1099-18 TaxID=1397361 RepID=A0A0F2LZ66_SPOSC|nr:PI phosphatase group protein [Sporothrix schenckii 1099-18]KJR82753.1 PI phosphatase group protein [Sporothrix schenckii 1099-18]
MARDWRNTGNMVSIPTLDLLLLTFNCAKAPINVADFAGHLQHALSDHSAASNTSLLPDLIVFSLQEVAPLGHAFAGSYFLNPFLLRFGDALTQAATQIEGYEFSNDGEEEDHNAGETRTSKGPKKPYHFIHQAHVGMTAILMYARDPSAISNIQVAHCGFGVADLGNKGAVGLRIAYEKKGSDDSVGSSPSELTFVATHLAAMEWNVQRRNANWRSIVAGLTFGNPNDVLADVPSREAAAALGRGRQGRIHDEAASTPRSAEEEAEAAAADAAGDDAWLLLGERQHEVDLRRQLHDLSIFRPDSLLFVAGDLNYRIGDTRPPADAEFPTASTWSKFLERDQLTEERLAGRTLHGMSEAPIAFPPTYKYDILSDDDIADGVVPDNIAEIREHAESGSPNSAPPVPWKYATHRWPSWCDRVLYLDVPVWVKAQADPDTAATPEVKVTSYKPLPLMRTSDHQAVYFRAQVPLLGKPQGHPEEDVAVSDGESENESIDPRVRLPVAIDIDAWARRARARNRERVAGGGMLLFNTRAGAAVMVTTLVVVVGLYWVWVGWL